MITGHSAAQRIIYVINMNKPSLHNQVICPSNDITYVSIKEHKELLLGRKLKKHFLTYIFEHKISSTKIHFPRNLCPKNKSEEITLKCILL